MPLDEDENRYELPVLQALVDALFKTNALEELEELLPHFRNKAQVLPGEP